MTDEAAFLHSDTLRALTERIEKMREQERARIARELHDELGQLLTGIKLDFSATMRRLRELKAPGDVVDRVQSAVGQIDIGIAMVRRIATDLRPAQLDHHDLGGAIEHEARRVAARTGLPIRVTTRLSAPVETERATVAFRIFQEALTNAVRHAKPTTVQARVSTRNTTLSSSTETTVPWMPPMVRTSSPGLSDWDSVCWALARCRWGRMMNNQNTATIKPRKSSEGSGLAPAS